MISRIQAREISAKNPGTLFDIFGRIFLRKSTTNIDIILRFWYNLIRKHLLV